MKAQSKRITIKDVASKAGVSAATVSIVLNGKGGAVPESTKERVRRAVSELNYSPDFTARAMVTRKTNIVGIVIPDISNAFFAEMVRRIQVELAKYGYDVMLCNSEEKTENDLRYIRLLAGRNVDALILTISAESLAAGNTERLKSALADTRLPCLFLDRYYRGGEPKVVVDNVESSYLAAKYLLDCGHTRIAALTGPLVLNSSYNRLKGLKKALAERGLDLPAGYIYEGKYDFESGVRGGAELMKTDATAIFAFSDMQAYGVYESAKQAGRRVPDDISVLGFDDTFYSAVLETPLTTMRQPVREIAEATCRTILDLVDKKPVAKEVRLPAELIIRDSVKKF